ncbi:peptidylprolyl isomerase [Tsuneonella mangrovi]|uniref:peptidylprolyl isomerase n=1 Tax=Tsuneonella mangrovi TaxID=1982042 RepID=UPI000BA291D1|nr:peptidylprolyl isomerase [Tsuneonella mangrovi]
MIEKTVSNLISGLAALALVSAPIAATAQDAQAGANPVDTGASASDDGGLNLPANVALLGQSDPNDRKPTAKVNGQIITGTDIDQRVALVVAANKGQISPQEMERLRAQVLRNLIDETIEIQAAKSQDISPKPEEIEQTYARVAEQNFKQAPSALDAYLNKVGSSPGSLKRQIEGELAWQNLLQRNVSPFVNVSSDEVNEMLDRLKASKGTEEYRLGEIYMAATPANQAQVQANMQKIMEQLRQGGSFVAYARQYSEASTAAVGGDLGFVRLETLPAPLAAAARQMQPGQLVGPIANSGGYSILYLIDKKQLLMADPRDATLSLKQISLNFPKGTTQEQATQRLKTFTEQVKAIKGCGDADAAAAAMGVDIVSNDNIKVRALPEQLQQIMLNLNIGQTTPPFGSVEDGVRVLMLCGRDDPPSAGTPTFDELRNQLENERVDKRAQRYLRDLRNDAIITYN